MPIRVTCPQGHKILAPEKRAGQRIRCPRCRSELRVPPLEANAAEETPTAKPPASAAKPPPPAARPRVTPPPLPTSRRPSTRKKPAEASASRQVDPPPVAPPERPPLQPTATPPKPPAEPAAADSLAADRPSTAEREPAELPPPAAPVVGMRHRPERIRGVYVLAAALAALAAFGLIPTAMECYDYLRSDGQQPVARWAWLAMAIGLLQLAYAVYLAQLPDWSTVWATAVATLGISMAYAMMYAVALLGESDSSLLAWLEIHALQTSRASAWCFVMLALNGIFAYVCGRAGSAWRHAEQLRASLGLK